MLKDTVAVLIKPCCMHTSIKNVLQISIKANLKYIKKRSEIHSVFCFVSYLPLLFVADIGKTATGFAFKNDFFVPHGKRSNPQLAFAVQRAIDDLLFQGFRIVCNTDNLVFTALKVAVFSFFKLIIQGTSPKPLFARAVCFPLRRRFPARALRRLPP